MFNESLLRREAGLGASVVAVSEADTACAEVRVDVRLLLVGMGWIEVLVRSKLGLAARIKEQRVSSPASVLDAR